MAVRRRTIADLEVMLRANTAQLTRSLDDVKRQVQRTGHEMKGSMLETQESVRLLGEEIGIRMPRALDRYVAKLPGVSTAMAAAFDSVAIVGLIAVIAEAGEKLAKFVEKNEEAAKRNREAWDQSLRKLRETNDELDLSNAKLDSQLAKLEHKPGNGLAVALAQARVETERLDDRLQAAIKDAQTLLKDRTPGMLDQMWNRTAAPDHEKTMISEHARWLDMAQDPQGMLRESKSFGSALAARLADLQWRQNNPIVTPGVKVPGIDLNYNYQNEIEVVQQLIARQKREQRFIEGMVQQQQTRAQIDKVEGIQSAGASAGAQGSSVKVPYYPFNPGLFKSIVEGGYLNPAFEAAAIAFTTVAPQGLFRSPFAMQGRGGNASPFSGIDTSTWEAKGTSLFPAPQPQITLKASTALGQLRQSAGDLADQFTATRQQLSEVFSRSLSTVNDTLMTQLTTPASMLRGRFLWSNAGAAIASGVGRTALEHGEGMLMHGLGFGHKADGTQSHPFWVRDAAKKGAGGVTGTAGGLLGKLNNSDWFGKHMGSFFGPGGIFDKGASSSGGGGGWFSSLFGGLFGGGHALGGDVIGGVPITVGELGPETFMPPSNGTIIPHAASRAAPSVHIDARGATDPAAIHAAVHNAMAAYLPHVGALSIAAQRDQHRRTPASRRS